MNFIKKVLSKVMSLLNKAVEKFDGLKQPANDKLLHSFYGTILAFIISIFHHTHGMDPILIVVFVTGVAFVKECIWTLFKKSPFSVMDIVFTVVPAILLAISLWV